MLCAATWENFFSKFPLKHPATCLLSLRYHNVRKYFIFIYLFIRLFAYSFLRTYAQIFINVYTSKTKSYYIKYLQIEFMMKMNDIYSPIDILILILILKNLLK